MSVNIASRYAKSTVPRVSSPLASYATSASVSRSGSEADSSSSGDDDSEDDDTASEDIDMSAELDLNNYLQAALASAKAREAGPSGQNSDSAGLEGYNLGDVDNEHSLPAVFAKPAVASEVFSSTTADKKGKGRAVADPEDEEILPGVTSKWGELPRAKRTKAQLRAEKAKTAGKSWFDLPRRPVTSLTNEEKREIQALRLSNAMDPKRFMRGEAKRDNKKLPEFFQMGYVVDSNQGPRAGVQAQSTKIKRTSFLDGLLADEQGKGWARRKYAEVQEKAQSGGRGFYKKKMHDRKSQNAGGKKRR